ncbi:MAG: hypothetical protein CMH52_07845 [Myxococcales bacterium]|nr:hypothetical protein [Myxococcales bacterium]
MDSSNLNILERLERDYPTTPEIVRLKAALLFEGVQFDPCLVDAASWAFPNFMPYHLPPGVPAIGGGRVVQTPYLFRFPDDTQARLRIKEQSPFKVRRTDEGPYELFIDGTRVTATSFETRQPWADLITADGTPMKATGLSQHGDMLVLNVAPGCEYFVVPQDDSTRTRNLSCKFCLYGLPDKRMDPLGQELYIIDVPEPTLERVVEACIHPKTDAKQLYLVGGSMLDMQAEGDRFVQIAEHLKRAGLMDRYYVACGSGAIPRRSMEQLKELGVRGACFNLEVWDPEQFQRVCPGKHEIVGRDAWIESLEIAVEVFGRGHVMSAFVGGAELEGEGCFASPDLALESAIEAGEFLTARGIHAVYSLHWKMTGKNRGQEPIYTLDFFLKLNEGLREIRRRHNLPINADFFSKRAAYMQLEPDYDAASNEAV